VNGNGITPDVVVEASQAMAAKPTDAAPAPEAQPAKAEVKAKPNLQCAQLVPTNAPTESEKPADDEVDCQLEQALQLLRQRGASTRS
jgi:hypothetical protein